MFTRKNVVRMVGVFVVFIFGLLGVENISDGEYAQAVGQLAIAALWIVWLILSPSFAFDNPAKKANPLQWIIPLVSGVIIAVLQTVR